MVRIGIVGIGFMGWIDYLATKHLMNARVGGGLQQRQGETAGDWRSLRGNFGPPGTMVDLSDSATTNLSTRCWPIPTSIW